MTVQELAVPSTPELGCVA